MGPPADAEIDWWPEGRIDDLQSFIDRHIRQGHVLARDAELLRWQHPGGDGALSVVGATSGGELVGILGLIPSELCVHGERFGGAWLTTWSVDPGWRGRAVGLRLLEFALERYAFVGTVGGNATTMRILGALRFATVPSIPRWVLPVDAGGLAALGLAGTPAAPVDAAGAGEVVIGLDAGKAAAWDDEWRRIAPSFVGTVRDAAFLRQRYGAHPRFRYELWWLRDDGRLRALVVHRTEQVRGAAAEVMRVVEALGDPAAIERLGRAVAAEARSRGVAFADFYCTHAESGAALARAGFRREEELSQPFPSRFQPLDAAPRPLTLALRLAGRPPAVFAGPDAYFTRSDGDQDRPNMT